MTKYFSDKELECRCCGELRMNKAFVGLLDEARESAGIPFKITSGYRCHYNNSAAGGSKRSSHLTGLAVDIMAFGSPDRFKILSALIDVGFTRIGIARDFIHVDMDRTKADSVIWMYN